MIEGIYHVLSVTIKIDMVLITLYKLNMKAAIIDTFQKPMNHRNFHHYIPQIKDSTTNIFYLLNW